ncbi:MAG: cytochrome c biogenesis protein CcsA [Tannerellaceae bacterium]|nr:cytochrome c biogenesis protein CcsA [Tannerellaceae bacterium]
MKTIILKYLSSPTPSIILMIIWGIALAAATVIEKYAGTDMAMRLVYLNPAFFLLLLAVVAGYIGCLFHGSRMRSMSLGGHIVHAAFIIILIGATATHLLGREGQLHLREGDRSGVIATNSARGPQSLKLPFEVELQQFTLVRYPGSNSPSSYESRVIIHSDGHSFPAEIYMNHVLDHKGWRIYQASFDSDERGSILSLTSDATGRSITYAGYAALLLGFIIFIAGPRSRFSHLRKMLREARAAKAIGLVIMLSWAATAAAQYAHEVPYNDVNKDLARKFGELPVQSSGGRIMPLNTLAIDLLRQLNKGGKVPGFGPDEFLLSITNNPRQWMPAPIIDIPNKSIAHKHSLGTGPQAFVSFFREGEYILQKDLDEAHRTPLPHRNKFHKDIIRLDEKLMLLHALLTWEHLRLFPISGDSDQRWASPMHLARLDSVDAERANELFGIICRNSTTASSSSPSAGIAAIDGILAFQQSRSTFAVDSKRIDTELRYNRLDPFRLCQLLYLLLGGALLAVTFAGMYGSNRRLTFLGRGLGIAVLIVFHFQMIGMSMRWHIGGYAPWSNAYETMVYVAWASLCGGLLLARRNLAVLALATLFSGIILFVARISGMNPAIGLLVPVLKSPWLMFHVAVIVAAYGFFGICCMLGIYNLALLRCGRGKVIAETRAAELTLISEMAMWIGLALMTVGTFLGAIWANESWGRYWGWDPKETWALISILTYAAVLHLRLMRGGGNNIRLFNLAGALAFLVVLMTYFGVNYLLSGMHSYQ